MTIDAREQEHQAYATDEQIEGVAHDVWAAFTGLELHRCAPGSHLEAEPSLSGRLQVDGAWRGVVVVTCGLGLARAAASAMLAVPVERLSTDDVADALGELTNMIGGNIKSVLPAPSRLALPVVTRGPAGTAVSPGTTVVNVVTLACDDGRVTVTVCEAGCAPRPDGVSLLFADFLDAAPAAEPAPGAETNEAGAEEQDEEAVEPEIGGRRRSKGLAGDAGGDGEVPHRDRQKQRELWPRGQSSGEQRRQAGAADEIEQ